MFTGVGGVWDVHRYHLLKAVSYVPSCEFDALFATNHLNSINTIYFCCHPFFALLSVPCFHCSFMKGGEKELQFFFS
jgi:hypothetical protein